MAIPGKQIVYVEALDILLEKADIQGYLTVDDVLEACERGNDPAGHTLQLFNLLVKKGIEVLNDGENNSPEMAVILDEEPPSAEVAPVDDNIEIYLREMSQVPLLKLDEEIQLAQRIERGRAAHAEQVGIDHHKEPIKFRDLETAVEDGLLAREHLIKANTRLVVSIAKRYVGRGVPLLDLIQEGNLGLMKAVEKFEYRRGFRFSTYATWWIRQAITRAVADQGRTIRLPVHMSDRIRQLFRMTRELEQSLGRPPTLEELAARLKLSNRKIHWLMQVSWTPLSLESPVGEEDDSELGMFVEDQITPTPFQIVYQSMLHERLENVLSTLPAREARILRMRFGLDDNHPYTLEEVGQKFGLTRERIRQIEGKALRRLRHPCRARQLKEYL